MLICCRVTELKVVKLHRLITFVLVSMSAANLCVAQRNRPGHLPRVGSLNAEEPAGDSRGGCDNHDIVWRKGGNRYFFLSAAEGYQAFMNLDGHNVELKQVRTTLSYIDAPYYARAVYEYQFRNVRITVRLTAQSDYTTYVPASITLRSGSVSRTIRGYVAPQCDAL
jgi:hypothetical protein